MKPLLELVYKILQVGMMLCSMDKTENHANRDKIDHTLIGHWQYSKGHLIPRNVEEKPK
jgi:hypothetical protein